VKKIGIVGGLAWASTADYYSGICRRSEQWQLARNPKSVPSTPEMSIESLDLSKAIALLGSEEDEDSWAEFDEYHRAALKRLETSGANFALIASNTAHHRLATIVRGIEIPVLSILEVVAKESRRIGAREVLILGTEVTMSSAKFRGEFAKYGVDASGPRDEAARAMTAGLIAELQQGKLEGTAARLGRIVRFSFKEPFKTRPVVCLACTELPLAFQEQKMHASFSCDGILYLNSTALHIDAAFDSAIDHSNQTIEVDR
jgi:aspartate racemase